MKPGTVVRLPDGREATVVYNGLDGVGVVWGAWVLTDAEVSRIYGTQPVVGEGDEDFPADLTREAMLRDPYPSASVPCVGEEYEVVSRPSSGAAR